MKKSLISIIFLMCIILTGCGNKYLFEGEMVDVTEVSADKTTFTYVNKTDSYVVGIINVYFYDDNGDRDKFTLRFNEEALAPHESRTVTLYSESYSECDIRYEELISEVINEEEQSKEPELSEQDKILIACSESDIQNAWHDFIYWNGKLSSFVEDVKEYKDTNVFAEELCRLYTEGNIAKKSDFVQDFLSFYVYSTCSKKLEVEIDRENLVSIWKLGYDKNGNVIKGEYYGRIFAEIEHDSYPHIAYSNDGNNNYTHIIYDEYWGIDDDKNSGTWEIDYYLGGLGNMNGLKYNKVELSEIDNILNECNELIALLQDCADKVFTPAEKAWYDDLMERTSNSSDSKQEPAIGMTKDEVLSSSWGEPDKKNIDEYEWGIEEQWVYDSRGYIYIEDDVVTAIQRRE